MRKADNLPPSCAVVTKSGNLNFLEPSGSLRDSNGTALHLYIYIYIYNVMRYSFDISCAFVGCNMNKYICNKLFISKVLMVCITSKNERVMSLF